MVTRNRQTADLGNVPEFLLKIGRRKDTLCGGTSITFIYREGHPFIKMIELGLKGIISMTIEITQCNPKIISERMVAKDIESSR